MSTSAKNTRPLHLVLGGTGGIGSALARQLASDGARVALAARGAERLGALAAELGGAEWRALDATSTAEVEGFARELAAKHGRLDGIANCVGSILLKPAHATSDEEWARTMALNLGTAFAAVRAAGKVMVRNGGSVVLMSSAAARIGLPSHESIAAAKAGIVGLALSAAATYARKGLRFNVVAPGLVETPMSAPIVSSPLMRQASEAMHPLGRLGSPEEVARAIAWLLDPANSWVTGQVLGVDGGLGSVRPKG
jgi:NAD(P)-dependent dehydrogenase (short-subunit alcohol dehydrogenase family)